MTGLHCYRSYAWSTSHPVGPNHPPISVAAVQLPVLPEETFIQRRHECSDIMASWVYDHILKAQQRNADKQARLLAVVNQDRCPWADR